LIRQRKTSRPGIQARERKIIKNAHFILLAHGSTDPRWCNTLEAGLERIRPGLANDTSLAYMEMANPTLKETISLEYARGTRRFTIVPLFFAAGRHLLTDVPLQVEESISEFSDLEITVQEAIGNSEAFWDFLLMTLND